MKGTGILLSYSKKSKSVEKEKRKMLSKENIKNEQKIINQQHQLKISIQDVPGNVFFSSFLDY